MFNSVFRPALRLGLSTGSTSCRLSRPRVLFSTSCQLKRRGLLDSRIRTDDNIARRSPTLHAQESHACNRGESHTSNSLESHACGPQESRACNPQLKVRKSAEPFDIHDGSFGPADYDVLISDINFDMLKNEISTAAGISYHSPATKEDVNKVPQVCDCFIYGRNLRTMFPVVVSDRLGRAFWVFFLVDSGSPKTYLSVQTCELFGIPAIREGLPTPLTIAGRQHSALRVPKYSHFADLDILGMDFLDANEISLANNFARLEAKLFFDKKVWKVMVEGEKL
ncbi:hypothetical protein HOY80DRAFT_885020 [Tuber brumale]|nr:hypothetical protein HOY80DRAFT_885020 [Tuber brumale]